MTTEDNGETVGEDGAGHYDERVVNDLCRPIDVVRTGYAEDADLPALVGGSCALLYPSLWEGFGIPPLEAMSAGTLVVASDVASLPEVLGEHPIYCDPYDPRSIASAMLRCLPMPVQERAARIERGRNHAARYTWKAAADHFVALLREHFVASLELSAQSFPTRAA